FYFKLGGDEKDAIERRAREEGVPCWITFDADLGWMAVPRIAPVFEEPPLASARGVVLRKLSMTCSACPSRWEGETLDGRVLYASYQHGRLTVGVGATLEAAVGVACDDGELLVWQAHGDEHDGVMSTDELLEVTGMRFTA